MESPIRVRFAPSPTGDLHIGTSRTALFNWLFARRYHGQVILRIEDTDKTRSTVEFEQSIIESLKWLGIDWDEGPDIGGGHGPYRQSERLNTYKYYWKRLLKSDKAYHCYCSPAELEEEREMALASGRMPMYSGKCRELSDNERRKRELLSKPGVIRFKIDRDDGPREIKFKDLIKDKINISSEVIGDFIIAKADKMPTYNFAAAVDDITMRISHVLRGEDHITNTIRQIMIYDVLGEPRPMFGHFSMILGKDKAKLSKRDGATSIEEYKSKGYLPESIINYLSLLSWSSGDENEIFDIDELVEKFSIDRVSKSPAIFDLPKLDWLNGQWIRRMSVERLTLLTEPYLSAAGMDSKDHNVQKITEAIRTSLTTLADAPLYAKIFFSDPELADDTLKELRGEPSIKVLSLFRERLGGVEDPDCDLIRDLIKSVAGDLKEDGIKGKAVYHPLRLALTGLDSGPELFSVIDGLGKEKTISRLDKVIGQER